jgi:hypothetical protein
MIAGIVKNRCSRAIAQPVVSTIEQHVRRQRHQHETDWQEPSQAGGPKHANRAHGGESQSERDRHLPDEGSSGCGSWVCHGARTIAGPWQTLSRRLHATTSAGSGSPLLVRVCARRPAELEFHRAGMRSGPFLQVNAVRPICLTRRQRDRADRARRPRAGYGARLCREPCRSRTRRCSWRDRRFARGPARST